MTNQAPSLGLDPGGDSSLGNVFRFILRKFLQEVDDMMPATVLAVTADRYYVTAQPNIMVLGTDGSLTGRAAVAKIPLLNLGAGGFLLSFPVKNGDQGWIKASDRDISIYMQKQAPAGPNTNRLHSFEDGVFIPDIVRTWALAKEDAANAVWQSADGTIKITMGLDQIKILHPKKVLIDTPLLECTGTIQGDVDVLSGPSKISGKGHTHPVSGSETGAPNA